MTKKILDTKERLNRCKSIEDYTTPRISSDLHVVLEGFHLMIA